MKKIAFALLMMAGASAMAQVHVRGYTKSDGTYVAPHERTAPNQTNMDNYSTKGNVNPYTGMAGTKQPDYGYQPVQVAPAPQPIQVARPSDLSQGIQPLQLQPLPSLQMQPIQPLKPLSLGNGF